MKHVAIINWVLRYFQWNRATTIRCRVGLGERTRPRVRRLTPRQPRPRAPPRVDPAWPGTRNFGIRPANRRFCRNGAFKFMVRIANFEPPWEPSPASFFTLIYLDLP